MKVHVLYFAQIRRALARDGESVELAPGTTVRGLVEMLEEREPRLAGFGRSLLVTVNEEWQERTVELRDGDTVGLMPPVSGG